MTITTVSDSPVDATDSTSDLLLRINNGDLAAWDKILRRYVNLVFATVWSFRLQEADALDAVQMTWLRLAENIHRISFPERLGAWLATTARRECIHILCQTKHDSDLIDGRSEAFADPSLGPEQQVIIADTMQTLWKFVQQVIAASPNRASGTIC